MRIKWSNIFAAVLLATAIVIVVKNPSEIGAFLMTINDIGPGHTPEQQFKGLLAAGLVLVALVASIRLLISQNNRRDR